MLRKFFLKIKNNRKVFFITLLISGIFLFFNETKAVISIESGISQAIAVVVKIQFQISAVLLTIGGKMLDMIIGSALDIQNMRAVELGWSLARDTVNMFFVIFLLVIAFATILRIESYHYKQLLPKLVVSILLVNFSRTICAVLIEFSNVLTSAFLNFGGGSSSAEAITALMGLQTVYQLDSSFSVASVDNFTMLASYILAAAIVTGIAWAFCGIAGMLVLRTVVLLVLIVLSPLAFGMNIIPLTQSYFKRWWDEFVKYLFYAPIAAFCLYLTAIVVSEARGIGRGTAGLAQVTGNTTDNVLPGAFTNTDFMWRFALAMGLLCLSILMIKEGGGMGASIAMDAAKKGVFGAYDIAGRKGGKWLRKKLGGQGLAEGSKKLRKSKSFVGRGFGRVGQGISAAARATYLPAAWKAQSEKEYSEQDALGTGWARNKLNKAFKPLAEVKLASVDPTDYEYRERMGLVSQARDHFKTENPGEGWQYLLNKMNKSKNSAGESHYVEEALRELNPTKNLNEVTRFEKQDSAFGHSMHTNDELIGKYKPEAVLDLLEKQFGKEEGRKMMMDMGEQGAAAGSWICKEYLMRDTDNILRAPGEEWTDSHGKRHKYSENDHAEGWAGEFSKRDINARVNVFRGDFNALEYDEEGEENITGLQKGYKKYVQKYGWGGQDAYRAVQRMSPNVKKALMEDKHFEEVSKVIQDQLTSKDKEIQTRGRNNLQFYYEIGEAVGMSNNVAKTMKKLSIDFGGKITEPGKKGVASYAPYMRGDTDELPGDNSRNEVDETALEDL